MKMTAKQMSVLVFAACLFALTTGCEANPKPDQIKQDTKEAVGKTKVVVRDAVAATKEATKKGTQKAGEVATDTAHHVKTGLQKAGDATTTAAVKVKEAVADAADTVKEKVKEITR